jgi:hypothetical protein
VEGFGAKVVLHFLPPYCPDHNRIERVWLDLYANVTRNHRCKTMKHLLAHDEVPFHHRDLLGIFRLAFPLGKHRTAVGAHAVSLEQFVRMLFDGQLDFASVDRDHCAVASALAALSSLCASRSMLRTSHGATSPFAPAIAQSPIEAAWDRRCL